MLHTSAPMQRQSKIWAGLFAVLVTAGSSTVFAQSDAERRLVDELREILRAPELVDAVAGVHVRSMKSDRDIYGHNAERLFNPASNQKILTTAAALWYLGANYRFRTEVRRDKKFEKGVVHGNLYVKGRGDPTLTTEQVFGLVNEVALAGVTEVKGHVIIDDTFFDNVREGPGWEQEIGDHAYAAPVGALSVNFNTFEVRVRPGESVGQPLSVEVWPPVATVEVVSNGVTRGRRTRPRIWVGTSKLAGNRVRVTVRGALAVDDYGKTYRRRVHDPARYAGEMIKHMLEMRGVRVKGRVKSGYASRRSTVALANVWSRPLAEIVSTLNKYSNNFMAEQILKTLSAELYEKPGSWELGQKAIREFLTEAGVDGQKVVLANGSGLNDANRITPAQLTKVLKTMYTRFEVRPEFVSSLAVAGSSGTITRRFEDSPAESRLRAKTGSLTGVSALSGYVVTQNDEVLAFSVMMNDYQGRARTMWRIQDRIGVALARFSRPEAVAAKNTNTPER